MFHIVLWKALTCFIHVAFHPFDPYRALYKPFFFTLNLWFSESVSESPGQLVKTLLAESHPQSSGLRWELSICMPNSFPGDSDDTDPGTIVWSVNTLIYLICFSVFQSVCNLNYKNSFLLFFSIFWSSCSHCIYYITSHYYY